MAFSAATRTARFSVVGVGRRSLGTSLQKRALEALSNKHKIDEKKQSIDERSAAAIKMDDSLSSSVNGEVFKDLNKENRNETKANDEKDAAPKEEEPTQAQAPTMMAPPSGQLHEFAPRIVVAGVGGGGGNAINNMISKDLQGNVHALSLLCVMAIFS